MKKITQSAFTMIELLVVISIIGILTAVSIFGLSGAREAGRDTTRKTDLESIRSALEFYRRDCGAYPNTLSLLVSGSCNSNQYMSEIPSDPIGGNYAYRKFSDISYTICTILENPPTVANDTTNCGMCSGGIGSCDYKVTNP